MGSAMTPEYMRRLLIAPSEPGQNFQLITRSKKLVQNGMSSNIRQSPAAPGAEYEKVGDRIRQGSRHHSHPEGHSDRDAQKSPVTADREDRLVLL